MEPSSAKISVLKKGSIKKTGLLMYSWWTSVDFSLFVYAIFSASFANEHIIMWPDRLCFLLTNKTTANPIIKSTGLANLCSKSPCLSSSWAAQGEWITPRSFVAEVFNPRTCMGGGWCNPRWVFFWNGQQTAGRIALKFCMACGASFGQLLPKNHRVRSGQVRSPRHDVIRGSASDRFLREIVFSTTQIAVINRNGDIMHGLGQHMTTCDISHCILIFQRSSEVNDLGWPHT